MKSTKHKMTAQGSKNWKLDTSKLSKSDLDLIATKNFPHELSSNLVIMKRILKREISGIFVDKEVIGVDDFVYLTTSRMIANIKIAELDTQGSSAAETKAKQDYAEKMLKTKAFSTVFIDSNHAQEELELLLATFGETKPTKNMEVIEPVKEEKIKEAVEEKTKNKISKLTDEQKAIVEDKYLVGKMSASEIADILKVAQLSVTNYIKQLTAK